MIYVIANRRGGSGKTTTAHALANIAKKALLIDLDGQGNLSFDAAGAVGPGSFEVLTGKASITEAIQKRENGPDLLPGSDALAAADLMIKSPYILRDVLAPVRNEYNFIFIDTPPALGILLMNALAAADGAIIAGKPEIHSFHGALRIREYLSTLKETTGSAPKLCAYVVTEYKARTILSRDMKANFDALAERDGVPVYIIPECNAVREAQALQTDITSLAPKSAAARAYNDLMFYLVCCSIV